jgi:hypothetical protein
MSPPVAAAGLVPGYAVDMKTRPAVRSNRGYGRLQAYAGSPSGQTPDAALALSGKS